MTMLCKIKINKGCILSAFLLTLLILSLSSCFGDSDALDVVMEESTSSSELKLSFVIPNAVEATRAEEGYEDGSYFENQIDITNHDFRIYFFSYSENDTNGGTLLAGFTPTKTTSSPSSSSETLYTVLGVLPNTLLTVGGNFRVVVLANWGNSYPTDADLTVGETTIYDLTEGTFSTFSAEDKFVINADNLIPFYGVHEYSDITFKRGETTILSTPISLLRALAKVEIVIDCEDDEEDIITLASATLHNYNSKGYCAPKEVYSQSDYEEAKDWTYDYMGEAIHLIDDKNDGVENEIDLYKVQDKMRDDSGNVIQKETWITYVPEYNNKNDDFSYIDIRLNDPSYTDEEQYKIYFAQYDEDGTTKAYDEDAQEDEIVKRRDIHRNNLYRFNVDFSQSEPKINVTAWENVFDNTWTYGDMSQVIEVDNDIEKDGIMYRVVTSDYYEDTDTYTLEVWIEKGQSQYVGKLGQFNIPETVTYLGYTYTVVGISANCFDADEEVIAIDIPATVSYIGDYAFSGCISLESLFFHSDYPPSCGENLFPLDDDINLTIYVPLEMEENFNIAPWNLFTIQEANF